MKIVNLILTSILSIFAISCAITPDVPLPDSVARSNPSLDCPREPQAGIWNIRAEVHQIDGVEYMAVQVTSPFDTIREPILKTTRIAIYKGHTGDVYFYDLGKISKSRYIGTLFVEDPSKSRVGSELAYETFKFERRDDSNCLKIYNDGPRIGALGKPHLDQL